MTTTMLSGATRESIHVVTFTATRAIPAGQPMAFVVNNPHGDCQWAEPANLADTIPGLFPEASVFRSDCQAYEPQFYAEKKHPFAFPMRIYRGDDAMAPLSVFDQARCGIQFLPEQPIFPWMQISCYIRVPTGSTLEQSPSLSVLPRELFVLEHPVILPTVSLELKPHLEMEVMPPGWSYDNKQTRFDLVKITVKRSPALGALIPLDVTVTFPNHKVALKPIPSEYLLHQILEDRPSIHCTGDIRLVYSSNPASSQLFLFRSMFLYNVKVVPSEHCYVYINIHERLRTLYPDVNVNALDNEIFQLGDPKSKIHNAPIIHTTGYNRLYLGDERQVWGTLYADLQTADNPTVYTVNIYTLGLDPSLPADLTFVSFSSMVNKTVEVDYTRFFSQTVEITYSTWSHGEVNSLDLGPTPFVPGSKILFPDLESPQSSLTITIKWVLPLLYRQEPFIIDFLLQNTPLTFTFFSQYRITSGITQFSDFSIMTEHLIESLGLPYGIKVKNTPYFVPFEKRRPTPSESLYEDEYVPVGHPGMDFIFTDTSQSFGQFIQPGFPLFSSCDIYLSFEDGRKLKTIIDQRLPYSIQPNTKRENYKHIPGDLLSKFQLNNFSFPLVGQPIGLVCQSKLSQPDRIKGQHDANTNGEGKYKYTEFHHDQGDGNDGNDGNDNNNAELQFTDSTPSLPDEYCKPPIPLTSLFSINVDIWDQFGNQLTVQKGPYRPLPAVSRFGNWKLYPFSTTISFIAYSEVPIREQAHLTEFITRVLYQLQNAQTFSSISPNIPTAEPADMFKNVTAEDLFLTHAGPFINHFDAAWFPQSYTPFDTQTMCRGLESFSYIDDYCAPNELLTLTTPHNAARLAFSIPINRLVDYSWDKFTNMTFRPQIHSNDKYIQSVLLIPSTRRGREQYGAVLGPRMKEYSFKLGGFTTGLFPLPIGATCTRTVDCVGGSEIYHHYVPGDSSLLIATTICWKGRCTQNNRLGLTPQEVSEVFSNTITMNEPYLSFNNTSYWYRGPWGLIVWICVLWLLSFLCILWLLSCWRYGGCCAGCIRLCKCCKTKED
jgi:hypothetical protein